MATDDVPLSSLITRGSGQIGKIDNDAIAAAQKRADALQNLNPIQKTFLFGLRGMENITPLHSTALRIYNDVVQNNRTQPITEKDLSPREQGLFAELVRKRAQETGNSTGSIDYADYMRHAPGLDSNILGGFQYAIGNDGGVSIKDMYDFNRNRGAPSDGNRALQLVSMLANPRGLAAKIGRDVVPDVPGIGIPVDINVSGGAPTADQRVVPLSSLRGASQ